MPQSVEPSLCCCCCCCVVSTKRSSSTPHQASCCPPQSHQAIVVVSTAVREWASPSVTVRGSADSWPGLEAYNERQGREFPLFHCVCVIGALCTMRCLHHHHTPLATTRGVHFCHSSCRTVGPARRSRLNKTQSHQSRHSPFSRPAVFVTYG